jgi:hypothetical protein
MVALKIEKSPVPIVWLDTSVITNMTVYKTNPAQLEKTQQIRIGQLYELVRAASRGGKLMCPLGGQEREVWIGRDEWMDTIHDLGLGIEFAPAKTIQDNQMRSAMSAYLEGAGELRLSYLDAFLDDPIYRIKKVLSQPVFVTVRRGILFGADYHRKKNPETLALLNAVREKNISIGVSLERQLETERLGDLNLLLKQCADLMNAKEVPEDENAFWGYTDLVNRVQDWIDLGGAPADIRGYIEFYKSEYNQRCPKHELEATLFAKIMVDPQPIRFGDPMDIGHISTLMPYSDLFITDKAWSTFLNKKMDLLIVMGQRFAISEIQTRSSVSLLRWPRNDEPD